MFTAQENKEHKEHSQKLAARERVRAYCVYQI